MVVRFFFNILNRELKLAKYFVLLIRLGKLKGHRNKTNKNTEHLNILYAIVFLGLPNLAKKNIECPIKFKFKVNNYFNMSHVIFEVCIYKIIIYCLSDI